MAFAQVVAGMGAIAVQGGPRSLNRYGIGTPDGRPALRLAQGGPGRNVPVNVAAPTGGKAPGVASAPDVMAPDGEWKSVNPQVRPYQAGLSAAQVKEGRYVLAGPCTDCHKIYDPVTFGKSEWDSTMSSMRGKAKLRGREFEDLKLFVRSIRQ